MLREIATARHYGSTLVDQMFYSPPDTVRCAWGMGGVDARGSSG